MDNGRQKDVEGTWNASIARRKKLNSSGRQISRKGGYSPDGLASQISRPHLYRACLGDFVENICNSQLSSKKHPKNENRVAEQVELIATETPKFPYF
ncbi:hypothetical protein TNCV_3556381 [Trichonephila clavipes]|nr:hypothetical protein TNCV_3556381 [Trichonephila clavipes]